MVVTNVRDLTEIYSLKSQIEKSAKEHRRLSRELELVKNDFLSHDLIAESPITLNVLRLADRVSELDTLVILLGETGVGKEVFAKYIHTKSPRKDKPFVRVNCGAIPENLIESELFGYEKGAFTGANRSGKAGLFEVADGGTIFLDEIGELPLSMQVRLLRVLQDQEIQRIGSVKPVKVNVRIIAATNRTLEDMVREGKFREDLYYRLMVFPINIPPLRQRIGDIAPLTRHFIDNFNRQYGFQKRFSEECFPVMEEYLWPGNIRELRNVIEQALIISNDEVIHPEDLIVFQKRNSNGKPDPEADISNLPAHIARLEKYYADEAYEKYGNVREAAKSLGISPATFVRKRRGAPAGKY